MRRTLGFSFAAAIAVAGLSKDAAAQCYTICSDGSRSRAYDCGTVPDASICRRAGPPAPVYVPPPPDPRALALQDARARYDQLLRAPQNDFLRRVRGWAPEWAGAPNDEASFTRRANLVHDWLSGWNTRLGDELALFRLLTEEDREAQKVIPSLEREVSALKRQVHEANARAVIAEREANRALREEQLIGLAHYNADYMAREDSALLSKWYAVVLPDSALAVRQSDVNKEPAFKEFEPPRPVARKPAPPPPPHPRLEAYQAPVPSPRLEGELPLGGPPERDIERLERRFREVSDTWERRKAQLGTNDDWRKPFTKGEKRYNLDVEKDIVASRLAAAEARLIENENALARYQENIRFQSQRFTHSATRAMIWRQFRKTAIKIVLDDLKKTLPANVVPSPYTMTSADIATFYEQGKRNIFGLAHHQVTSPIWDSSIVKVQKQTLTLLQHAQGYAEEAARVLATGSPGEIQEHANTLFNGLDRDSEEIVKRSLSGLKVPEPYNTVIRKHFLSAAR